MPTRRLAALCVCATLARVDAGARDAFQKSLQSHAKERPPARSQVWDKSFRCIPAPRNATRYAYAVVLGPISEERKYHKWLYPILALRTALKKRGSAADLLVFLALEEGKEDRRMLPDEEQLLTNAGVRTRYVPKPRIRGFHMGHYKLWAWQHTEYARIQILDADVLPLVDMDALFHLPGLAEAPFVGCPGKDSVLNAGWFSLKPDCEAFKRLTDLLWYRGQRKGHPWDMEKGWGMPMPPWLNARGRRMATGWNFFDSRGNQGHMYAYFRFFARDLTLVYGDRVLRWGGGAPRRLGPDARTARLLGDERDVPAAIAARGDGSALSAAVWDAFPCPFFENPAPDLAYFHFTGNTKPWSKYDTTNSRFRDWYAALAEAGVDVASIFKPEA
mmetsp:Transcript_3055/g.9100  ORF Transcript_3055/g.9100 Transcript_3055/m.9100 type:complete len:388 (-) Transcript_3055:8-1171(-)